MWCNSLYRYGAGCGRCSCFLIVLAQPARSKKRSGSGSGCGIERWSRKLIKLKGIWYRSGTRRPRRSGDSQDRRTNDRHGSDSGMEKWRVLPLTVSSGVTRWLAGRLRRVLWDDGDLTIDGLNKLAISNTFQFLYFHHRELGSSIFCHVVCRWWVDRPRRPLALMSLTTRGSCFLLSSCCYWCGDTERPRHCVADEDPDEEKVMSRELIGVAVNGMSVKYVWKRWPSST